MKKKIITLFICAIAALSAVMLSACSESCISCLFKPKTPTVKSVRENLSKYWEFDLPKNITLVNYALDIGRDSKCYYVFDYDGNDETFNTLLSSEKNEEFEQNFLIYSQLVKDDFIKEYSIPDLSEDYLCAFKSKNYPDSQPLYLFVLYFQTENQLVVFDVNV